jgi:hypothetical protein
MKIHIYGKEIRRKKKMTIEQIEKLRCYSEGFDACINAIGLNHEAILNTAKFEFMLEKIEEITKNDKRNI